MRVSTSPFRTPATGESVRRRLHFPRVADFLTGYAIDRRFDAVKDDDRALCVLQDRLIFLVELFVGFKVEIFARLFAPIDLAFAVVVRFDEPFQLAKERFRVLYGFARLSAGSAAALIAVRVVQRSNRSLLIRIGPNSAFGNELSEPCRRLAPPRNVSNRQIIGACGKAFRTVLNIASGAFRSD